MFEVLGWIFTAVIILPAAFVTINYAVDCFVGWINKGRF